MLQLDGYIRVSRVAGREGDSFISPDVQRGQIQGWADNRGVTIANWEQDLDQTGKKLSRPGLDRIMGRIESKQTGGIAVATIDRLSRAGVADALRLIETIVNDGGKLAAVDLGIDPTTIFGEFALTVMLALGRMQVRQAGEKWFVARREAVDRGVFVGGFVPPGYLKNDDGRLLPNLAVPQVTIGEFFDRRGAGESWGKLSAWLSGELGYNVSAATVRNMIKCRTYLGEVHGGQGLVNRTAHKPLVTRVQFEAANAMRGVAPARSGKSAGVLSGILRCAGCRYSMKATQNKSRHGRPFLEYRCKATARERTEACESPTSVSANLIEHLVLGRFFDRVGEYRLWSVEGTQEIEDAEALLTAAEAELDAALDIRLADALGGESARYLELVADRQQAVGVAQAALAKAQSSRLELPDANLSEVWPDLSLHERRRLLASALDCVFVRRGSDVVARTHFCWHGEAPELPTSGRRWTPQPFDFPG